MSKIQDVINETNNRLQYYEILIEDGSYKVVNKETSVTEMTTTILPEALFQSRHIEDMVNSFVDVGREDNTIAIEAPVDEDPVLN